VAIQPFGGFESDKVVIAEAAALELEVENSPSLESDASYGEEWFVAGYDPPFRLTNRHNEIWLPVIVGA
jgi:hypothetical protein